MLSVVFKLQILSMNGHAYLNDGSQNGTKKNSNVGFKFIICLFVCFLFLLLVPADRKLQVYVSVRKHGLKLTNKY